MTRLLLMVEIALTAALVAVVLAGLRWLRYA